MGEFVESPQLSIAFVENRGVGSFGCDKDDRLFTQRVTVTGGADGPGEEGGHQ